MGRNESGRHIETGSIRRNGRIYREMLKKMTS